MGTVFNQVIARKHVGIMMNCDGMRKPDDFSTGIFPGLILLVRSSLTLSVFAVLAPIGREPLLEQAGVVVQQENKSAVDLLWVSYTNSGRLAASHRYCRF